MISRYARRIPGRVACVALFTISASVAPAVTSPGKWGPPRILCDIADKRLAEASGIAESRRSPGLFFVHNDGGDSARFFAVGKDGATRFVVNVRGAADVDWEDIAAVRDTRGKPVVFLADIGDNTSVRKDLTIYEVPDPAPPRGKSGQTVTVAARAIRFRYPDGAHDAETLMAEPGARALYIVSKARKGETTGVYRLNPAAPGVQTALKIGELRFSDPLPIYPNMATGGDISADGSRMIVRTYQCAYEWRIPKGETLKRAIERPPEVTFLALEKQGESICYGLNGKAFYTTSEQRPTPIYVYEWRAG